MPSIRTYLDARGEAVRALAIGLIVFTGLTLIWPCIPYRLTINRTPSIPEGVYLIHRLNDYTRLDRGTLVEFRYECPTPCVAPFNTYPQGTDFLKHVVGIPGDRVTTAEDRFTLSEAGGAQIDLGHAIHVTPTGKLVPYHAVFKGELIPAANYFAAGDQDVLNSYDSRYFGLVSADRIEGVATLVWQW